MVYILFSANPIWLLLFPRYRLLSSATWSSPASSVGSNHNVNNILKRHKYSIFCIKNNTIPNPIRKQKCESLPVVRCCVCTQSNHNFIKTFSLTRYCLCMLRYMKERRSEGVCCAWQSRITIRPFSLLFCVHNFNQVYSLSTPRSYHHNTNGDPKDKFRRVAVNAGTMCCEQLVLEGTYGRVYSGTLHHPSGEQRNVLIKTVVG